MESVSQGPLVHLPMFTLTPTLLLSVLTLSLGLSGCGKSDKNNATESATAVTTEAVTEVATEQQQK